MLPVTFLLFLTLDNAQSSDGTIFFKYCDSEHKFFFSLFLEENSDEFSQEGVTTKWIASLSDLYAPQISSRKRR